jgi:hypothetical protein
VVQAACRGLALLLGALLTQPFLLLMGRALPVQPLVLLPLQSKQ